MKLIDLSWPKVKEVVKTVDTAVLPIGAVEAHGPHLTVDADNIICSYLAEEFSEKINGLLLPVLSYGQVWSLKNFPGSINVKDETIINLIFDIAESLERNGLKNLVIVNSHFGNNAALKKACRKTIEGTNVNAIAFTHPGLEKVSEGVLESKRAHPNYLHAEEIETSMILYISSDKVNMDKAVADYPCFPKYFSSTSVPWDKITKVGVIGDATVATKEKGMKLLQGILENMVDIYEEWKDDCNEVKGVHE
ncbi:creatininase family protein [Abyssisolibacter fermentans]|uniref:creatininase family protein n=1 Tax=Abyssisolibacter fermentans TaxID=1766203 RepID=UPI0008354B4A|nr:creatininase family protein [Abyssisolibacter fermentans]